MILNSRRLAGPLMAVCGGLLLLPLLVPQFIPDHVIEQSMQQLLIRHGITLHATRIGTAFPLRIIGEGVSLAADTTPVLSATRLQLRLRLLPLLTGKVSCSLQVEIGQRGNVTGDLTIWPKRNGTLQVTDLDLGDLPVLSSTLGSGIHGATKLDIIFTAPDRGAVAGDARLTIHNLVLHGVKLSGMPLPNASFPEVRGLLKLKGQTVVIDNLALQGNGIYLRLTGAVPLTPHDNLRLALELLPTAELLRSQQSIFFLLTPYQTSPGSFKLPIGGTPVQPQLTSLQ